MPPKLSLPLGDPGAQLVHGSFVIPESIRIFNGHASDKYFDQLSRFAGLTIVTNRHARTRTHRHKYHATSIATDHIDLEHYCCDAA